MRYYKPGKLYCFSPLVMIATFSIEILFALYTLWRYKLSDVTKLVVAILACLAVFQLAEFNVCESARLFDSAGWARLGYVAITLLPPLGIHLVNRLSGDSRRWPYIFAYILGGTFAGYFLFMTGGISAGICLGNYVIFEQGHNTAYLYGFYYYSLLILAILYALYRSIDVEKHVKKSLYALAVGYALFLVPTTFINIIDPSTITGIPSIMCGFAVLLAIVLVGKVLPYYHEADSLLTTLMKPFKRK